MEHKEKEKLKKKVNRSGFPLQIALENEISSRIDEHGWKIYSREHSWKNDESGTSGFIDIVLLNQYDISMMVVECKRVQNSNWIFLNPTNDESKTKTWISNIENGETRIFSWTDIVVYPVTSESEFCVVPGQDSKSKPMLERIAAELTEATEGFAREDFTVLNRDSSALHLYFNVIVTTARLKVCGFQPNSISLTDGILNDAEFNEVPYLRFRKQLSVNREIGGQKKYRFYGSPFSEKENTVFIVNSSHLIEFLCKFDINSRKLDHILQQKR